MKIAVLGTGTVGRTLAGRLAGLGHDVTVGTRDPDATLARAQDGGPSFSDWLADHPSIRLAAHDAATTDCEVVVNATSGGGALAALEQAGATNLAGKVLLDVSNPLDFSNGFPPTLSVVDTDSLGEQLQRAFPDARVVKALNTMTAEIMVHPSSLPEPTSVFVAGNDDEAKAVVTALLESFGHTDVIDLGDITSARGAEMYLPLWLRLMGSLGTAAFNIRVVR